MSNWKKHLENVLLVVVRCWLRNNTVKVEERSVCCRAYLTETFWQALECKLVVAEFTVPAVGGGKPLLQAGPVHHGQGTRALARGQELPWGPAFMADPTEQLLGTHTGTQETTVIWEDSGMWVSEDVCCKHWPYWSCVSSFTDWESFSETLMSSWQLLQLDNSMACLSNVKFWLLQSFLKINVDKPKVKIICPKNSTSQHHNKFLSLTKNCNQSGRTY